MKARIFWSICALGLMLASCSHHWAETQTQFEGVCWQMSDTLTLEFESEDTSKVFALGFPITIDDDYPFNNIYLHARLTAPSGDTSIIPAEFVLADRTGAWLTEPDGDMATFELKVSDGLRFSQQGKYTLRLYHYMRENELCGVESVGIALDQLDI
jgi:gliding motility-associated lipoprotein GldH